MKTLSGMTGEELDDKYGPGTSNNMRLALSKSPQYSQIQKAMKALLDKFYQKNNLSNNDLIEWEIPYSFADQDETKCKATEYIVENVINGLDPRIKATFFKPTSRNDILLVKEEVLTMLIYDLMIMKELDLILLHFSQKVVVLI